MPAFGRIPSPYDARDLPLRALPLGASPLALALAAYEHTRSQKNLIAWLRLATTAIGDPTPPDPPLPPAPKPIVWRTSSDPILDQGNTGHCVGFGGAGFLAAPMPRDPGISNADGDALYYECKDVDDDGAKNRESGSYVRTLAKVLVARSRVGIYAWASTTTEIVEWLQTSGPVVVGTDWFDGMMDPPTSGIIRPTGSIAGGHCYVLVGGTDAKANASLDPSHFLLQNSWGRGWGHDGLALIAIDDFATLLDGNGEALVSIELPL